MADEVYIDPETFFRAYGCVGNAQQYVGAAYGRWLSVLAGLGDFLGNDDAGHQLKAQYRPAEQQFRAAMEKLAWGDLENLRDALQIEGNNWSRADETPFGD